MQNKHLLSSSDIYRQTFTFTSCFLPRALKVESNKLAPLRAVASCVREKPLAIFFFFLCGVGS